MFSLVSHHILKSCTKIHFEFRVSKKMITILKKKSNISINVFVLEKKRKYIQFIYQSKILKMILDLLLINNKGKSQYVYIKDLD